MESFPIKPSDLSYSQVYARPFLLERSQFLGMSSLLNILSLIILFSFALGVIWYKKYQTHLQVINQQRIMLERIWKLSSTK